MSPAFPPQPDPAFVTAARGRARRASIESAAQRMVLFLIAAVPSFIMIAMGLGPGAVAPGFGTWITASTSATVFALGVVAATWPKHSMLTDRQLAVFSVVSCALPVAIPWGLVAWVAGPLDETRALLLSMAVLVVSISAYAAIGAFSRRVTALVVGVIATPNVIALATDHGFASLPSMLLIYGLSLATVGGLIARRSILAREYLMVRTESLLHAVDSERANLALLNAELEHRATHDQLMGIPNRMLFQQELSRALHPSRGDQRIGLLFCDLDRFKYVNDTFGHQAGDALLVAVGKRIEAAIKDEDALVARVGGDELVVLLRDLTSSDHLENVAERLLAKFGDAFTIDGNELNVGASIGMAETTTGSSPDDLIQHADAALYEAKQRGRSQAVRADQALRAHRSVWLRSERMLRMAIEHHEIEAWFQPEVDLITGEVQAAEALARWRTGDDIEVAGSFIDVARKGGLLEPLMFSMIDQIWAWRLRTGSTMPVSVNVTVANLQTLITAQDDAPLGSRPLEGLRLEIAEPDIVSDFGYIVDLLRQARALGAEVFIDNFGEGNSSLKTLADLPIDGVKIDRSLIDRLETDLRVRQLVTLLAEFGRECEITVVAEGVETTRQADFLARVGIDRAQGLLFGTALETDDFELACEFGCGPGSLANLF